MADETLALEQVNSGSVHRGGDVETAAGDTTKAQYENV